MKNYKEEENNVLTLQRGTAQGPRGTLVSHTSLWGDALADVLLLFLSTSSMSASLPRRAL